MKKNTKKAFGTSYALDLNDQDLPQIVDMDALSSYDDDHLDRHHNYLQAEREKVLHSGSDTHPWEVEICYVQREIKIRNTRRVAHEKYIRTNPDLFQDNFSSFE